MILFFGCLKILGEAGKYEILQQMFRKLWISNRLPNRYFPKIDVGCPCFIGIRISDPAFCYNVQSELQ